MMSVVSGGEMRTVSNRRAPSALVASIALLLAACSSVGGPDFAEGVRVDPDTVSEANISSLSAAIQQNPGDASAYNVRGSAYGHAGLYKEALRDFDAALKLDPSFASAYANRALVHRRQGKINQAVADYGRAVQVDPQYAPAYVGRGNLYRQQGRADLALADYNAAIALDAAEPQAFHNRGLAYQTLGQHQQAIEDFTRAIGLAPLAADPHAARGLSYFHLGDLKSALSDTDEALKRDGTNYLAWTNRGVILERLGRTQEAYAAYTRAVSSNREYVPATEGLERTKPSGA